MGGDCAPAVVPAPPPRPNVPSLVASFRSIGCTWQPGPPRPPANVVVAPRSSVTVASQRRATSPVRQQASSVAAPPQRPSTARASISPRSRDVTPRSVPPPSGEATTTSAAGSSSQVAESLTGRRPLTAGHRISNQQRELKTEQWNVRRAEASARSGNPDVGPLKYDSDRGWRATQKRTPHCPFSSCKRLGILKQEDVDTENAAARTKATAAKEERRRPMSARLAHRPGKGHWLDGMATGSTIPGHYNRYLQQNPGVSAYDIRKSSDLCRAHSPRGVFGTAGRFPGDKRVNMRNAPAASSTSPRASRNVPPRAPAAAA